MADTTLLVGDNPFHNISHLSQERTRLKEKNAITPEKAADLISIAIKNGADGFMFSVSETTLSILKKLKEKGQTDELSLHAIVPYAYEYVKLATQVGGISGLARKVGARILVSGSLKGIATGAIGILRMEPFTILKTYLTYEVSRIRSAAGKTMHLECVFLHEVITDLALALNMEWLFKSHIAVSQKLGTSPGFNTCNFPYLMSKLREWNLDSCDISVAAPFNKIGFQMSPSKNECEKTLQSLDKRILVAISIMAAGYLKPREALEYVRALPNVKGIAIGVSSETQAQETFKTAQQIGNSFRSDHLK